MHSAKKIVLVSTAVMAVALGAWSTSSWAQVNAMSFFVTSVNPGKGADFGGLAGADAYCEALAAKAGAPRRNWRAYLSATAGGGAAAVNARDRIGRGPWQNVKGEVIARNVDELHGNNNLSKLTALTEKGETISGRGDLVNTHDILTGSTAEGLVMNSGKDTTCGNWNQSGEGSAIVGHHDRVGTDESAPMKSWNSSHATPGCSPEKLRAVGGGGLLYCFAVN